MRHTSPSWVQDRPWTSSASARRIAGPNTDASTNANLELALLRSAPDTAAHL